MAADTSIVTYGDPTGEWRDELADEKPALSLREAARCAYLLAETERKEREEQRQRERRQSARDALVYHATRNLGCDYLRSYRTYFIGDDARLELEGLIFSRQDGELVVCAENEWLAISDLSDLGYYLASGRLGS